MTTNYDTFAKAYADKNRMDHPLRRAVYARWMEVCGDVRGIDVVDAGCGSGASSEMLAKRGAYVFGIDNSSEMLRLAALSVRNISKRGASFEVDALSALDETLQRVMIGWVGYTRMDIFGPPAFDFQCLFAIKLVTAVLSIHYADSRERLTVFFRNVGSWLLSGGRFVAVMVDPDNPIMGYWPGTMCESRWMDTPWQEGSRIEVNLYGADGNKLTAVIDYYWTRQTHEELMLKYGLVDIQWIRDGALLQTPLVILKANKLKV